MGATTERSFFCAQSQLLVFVLGMNIPISAR